MGDAKVREDGVAAGGEENIGRFNIAVNHASLVSLVEGAGGLADEFGDFGRRHGLTGGAECVEALFQSLAVYKFHDHVIGIVLVAKIENTDNIGVPECGHGPRLALKAGQECLVIGHKGVQDFDRHVTIQRRLVGFVYLGHAAPAQVLYDLVMAYGFADPCIIHVNLSLLGCARRVFKVVVFCPVLTVA